jgi:hypothetical protein
MGVVTAERYDASRQGGTSGLDTYNLDAFHKLRT